MYNFFIAFVIILHNLLPASFEKYDYLVIPIKKNLYPHKTRLRSFRYENIGQTKLDVKSYEELTEIPNLDIFDYDKESDREMFGRAEDSRGMEELEPEFGDDKIVGGIEVDINLYPYHVAYGTNCGGAIIDRKWVLTAGHCGKKPYIRAGSKYNNQGKKILVKKSYIHPNWAAKKKDHPFDFDFQLLELNEPLKLEENVQPIKLARIEDMVIGKVITVTGWGNTEENGPFSNVLRAVRVPIISKELCQNVPFPYFRGSLTPRMFCAGYQEGKKDACQGDSGGPAAAHDRLLGMVSFGYGCATPGSYGVYSKVAKIRGWIEQITGLNFDYILGGHPIKINEAPYQLSYGDVCGAALIHKKWALTSAHCGTNYTFIRIGSTYRLEGKKIEILRHIVHPQYQKSHKFDYDVQLLKLEGWLKISDVVKPIRVGRNKGDSVIISGWGYSEEKGEYQDILQQATVRIVPFEKCQRVDKSWFNHTLTNRMFCAGGWEQDACQGDSGGGAVSSSGKLVGLSSFGYGCGRKVPGVYTKLSHKKIKGWLESYTEL